MCFIKAKLIKLTSMLTNVFMVLKYKHGLCLEFISKLIYPNICWQILNVSLFCFYFTNTTDVYVVL